MLSPAEYAKIEDFYLKNQYDRSLSPYDHFLVIDDGDEILAALRVCHEQGSYVLRGMRVSEDFQRRGFGSKLLDYFKEFIVNKGCYCIAHSYLKGFYGRVGFEEINLNEAPEFLTARFFHYRTELGRNVRLMYKPPTGDQVNC